MSLPALLGWIFRLLLVVGGSFVMDRLFPAERWSWRIHDFIYQRLPPVPPDTQIVIVDIAQLGRADLARLLLKLGAAQPSFIGIDAVFHSYQASPEDTLWMQALCSVATRLPVCLVSTLDLSKPMDKAPKSPVSHSSFTRCVEQAFANLILQDSSVRLVREALIYTISEKDTALSLGARTALAINPRLRDTLFKLPAQLTIRYRGSFSHFYFLSGEEVLKSDLPLDWLRGRVLLLGVADPLRRTMEDIFFSPLEGEFCRRSMPDMYGVLIHANIAAMLAHKSFFENLSILWTGALIVFSYLLLSVWGGMEAGLRRSFFIRLTQVALIWGAIELTLWLGKWGYWLSVEPLLWAILIGGEIEMWRAPCRRRLA
ncbi:MAG: CHASE2 domain-containing protein [Bacteroidia bacterium]|nr:CHASE2 domain-containing protein [Bacteroidia bacterium]